MKLIQPLIYHCPAELEGDARHVMNVLVNGAAGNLGPFTITQIMIYSDMDRRRVDEIIEALRTKNLVKVYTYDYK